MNRSLIRVVILKVLAVILLLSVSFPAIDLLAQGAQMALVSIWLASKYAGQPIAFIIPFNASIEPSYQSTYVLYTPTASPVFSHLFSSNPPVVIVFEPSAPQNPSYTVYWGGVNPYTDYTVSPDSGVFGAYDDFDYKTDLWIINGSYSYSGSLLKLFPGAVLETNATFVPQDSLALWRVQIAATHTAVAIDIAFLNNYTGYALLIASAPQLKDLPSEDYVWPMLDNGTVPHHSIVYYNSTTGDVVMILPISGNAGETKTLYIVYGKPLPEPNKRFKNIELEQAYRTYLQAQQKLYKIQTGLQPRVKWIKIRIENITLEPGDTLAPHLYNWHFDGASSYIEFSFTGTSDILSVYVYVAAEPTLVNGRYAQHVVKLKGQYAALVIDRKTASYGFYAYNSTGGGGAIYLFPSTDIDWHWLGMIVDATSNTAKVFTDGSTIEKSINLGDLADYTKLYVSAYPFTVKGYVSTVILYEEVKEIPSETYVIEKPEFFADSTFFNGTHFINLVNDSIGGVPYDGVARVPAEEMWLWVVKGLYIDSYLHLRFFPYGSVVRIYNASSGDLIAWFRVVGSVNPVGLVEHFVVPVDLLNISGNVSIEVETWVGDPEVVIGGEPFVGYPTQPMVITYSGSLGSRDSSWRTSSGGIIWWEYVSDELSIGIYAPGKRTVTDFANPESIGNIKPFKMHLETSTKYNTTLITPINITIETTTEIKPNTTIAPHIYDWWFVSDVQYIEVDNVYLSASEKVTFKTRFRPTSIGTTPDGKNQIVRCDNRTSPVSPSLYVSITSTNRLWFEAWNSSSTGYDSGRIAGFTFGSIYENHWYNVECTYNGTLITAKINENEYTFTPLSTGPINYIKLIRIGRNTKVADSTWSRQYYGYISYIELIQEEKVVFLMDATFFNGTHYINLVNETVVGVPYGGVKRVLAEEMWLWIVYNASDDSLVHLRFFPVGTVVRFYNASSGELVKEVVVSGPINVAGLVEDCPVYLPEGSYRVVAIIAPHRYQIIKMENVYLANNYAIAPHLYDWYLDGIDDYILFDWDDTTLPVSGTYEWEVRNRAVSDGYSPNGLGDISGAWWFQFLMRVSHDTIFSITEEHSYNDLSWRYSIARINNQTKWGTVVVVGINTGGGYSRSWAYSWTVKHVIATFDGGELNLTYQIVLEDSGESLTKSITADVSEWGSIPYYWLKIGDVPASGYKKPSVLLSYAWLKHDGQYLFLVDPTFYNGTHYFSLVNNIVGTPYGGVARVPATKLWLWVVEDLYDDGYLHLRFFPYGSVVRLYDTAGNLQYVFFITCTPNGAGLCEDYKVRIGARTYNIEVLVPYPYESISVESVSNAEARDGNVVDIDAKGSAPVGITALLDLYTYSYTLTTRNPPDAFVVWGNFSYSLEDETPYEMVANDTAIQVRFYRSGSQRLAVAVLNISNSFGGNFAEIAVLVYTNGSWLYLYYAPDQVFVNTSIKLGSGWYLLTIAFEKPNRIRVLLGNGSYVPGGIYQDSPEEFVYNATNYGSFLAVYGIGVAILGEEGYASVESVLYDWVRVIQWPVGRASIVGEVTDVRSTESVLLVGDRELLSTVVRNLRAPARMWFLKVGDEPRAVSVGSYIKTIFGIVVNDSSNTIYTAVGNSSWSRTDVEWSEWMLFNTNGTEVEIGGPFFGVYIEYEVAPELLRFYNVSVPEIVGKNSTKILSQYQSYVFGTFGAGEEVPIAIFRYGWAYINVTSKKVYICTESGGCAPIAQTATSFVLALGAFYEESTNATMFYTMYIPSGGSYIARYVTVEGNMSAEPFVVEAVNATVMIDRFCAVYGLFVRLLATGEANMVVRSPFPMQTVVKMVYLDQPTIVEFANGTVVIRPGGSKGITLKGFSGFRLTVAVGGVSASNIPITGNSYTIDVPLGYTAMLIVDPVNLMVTIMSATPVQKPEKIKPSTITFRAPKISPIQLKPSPIVSDVNRILWYAVYVALAIGVYILGGDIGLGIAVSGGIAAVIGAISGDMAMMSFGIVATVVGAVLSIAMRRS